MEGAWFGPGGPLGRFDIALIAALTIVTKGGLIPHAWHGGSGVCSFAVAGSKLGGTWFDMPHIEQTQVALTSLAGAGDGVDVGKEDPTEPISASLGDAYRGTGLLMAEAPFLAALGKRVIFGDDLRKPA